MLEYIKNLYQKRQIKLLGRNDRTRKIENLQQVQTIGIAFTVGDENSWNLLFHFAQVMERQGKKVTMIGFQSEKTELNYIITHAQTIICREKEDFDFWGIPKKDAIDRFISQHYDVYIDTTDQPNFFGQYIALKSNADLKITYTDEIESTRDDNIFDMMIHGEGIVELREYLNHVVQYLNMIKK